MKYKLTIIISILLISIMILTSCASSSVDLMDGIKSKNEKTTSQSMDEKLNRAILDFTWSLFKNSSENEGNIMISPASVYTALAMAVNGADGETKEEMLKALSADNITSDDLNSGLYNWMNELNNDGEAKLSITNSIWYRDGFKPDREFLQTNADYYMASVKSLDFKKKSSVDTINEWVKDATNNKIEKIVDEIPEEVVMYLINAIYFNGDWKYKFSANDTREGIFKRPYKPVKAEFMNRTGEMDYLDYNGVTGVILPYADERFAFVGLLPKEGETPRELLHNFSAVDLIKLLKSKEQKKIELKLPKFEVSYEDSLKDELLNMGMKVPFEPISADFSNMNETNTKDLFIDEIKHKTYIRVDEKGTEAAAVTSIGVELTSMPPELPKLTFDRPFVYGIIDVNTGIPLFIGIMENPTVE